MSSESSALASALAAAAVSGELRTHRASRVTSSLDRSREMALAKLERLGTVQLLALAADHLSLGVHGMGLVVLTQALWFCGAARMLWRAAR